MFKLTSTPVIEGKIRKHLALLEKLNKELSIKTAPQHLATMASALSEIAVLVDNSRREQNSRTSATKALARCAETAANSVTSLRDAIEAGDRPTIEQVQDIKVDVHAFVRDFADKEAALALDTQKEEGSDRAERLYEKIATIFDGYAHFSADMPSTYARKYKNAAMVLLKLPVIPIVASYSTKAFDRINLKYKVIGDYIVLEEQLVLGINRPMLAKSDYTEDEYVETAIAQINKRLGRRYVKAYERHAVGAYGFLYYWLMEERILDVVLRATHGGADAWGFPFKV